MLGVGDQVVRPSRVRRPLAFASAMAWAGSRSAQATSSNESKAFAFSAYARLITPQPMTPTLTRPPPACAAAPRRSGRVLELGALALVLLDDQPLGARLDRGRGDALVAHPAVADGAELALAARAQVLDVHERPAAEQVDRVDARVPRPARVELEEHVGRQAVEEALRDLGVVVVVAELEPGAGGRRRGDGDASERVVGQVRGLDVADDEPLPAERARLGGERRRGSHSIGLELACRADGDEPELVQPARDRRGIVTVQVEDLDPLVADRGDRSQGASKSAAEAWRTE